MRIALLCSALLLPLSIFAADVIVDTDDLLTAAKNSMERMKKETATWTVEITGESGSSTVIVETVKSPTMRRIVLSVRQNNDTVAAPIITIIVRDNKWYVDELGGISGVYLPGQAPFHLPMSNLLLFDDVQWVTEEALSQLGTPVEQAGDVVTFRAQMDESTTKFMKEQLEKVSVLNSKFGTSKNRSEEVDGLRKIMNNGVIKKANIKTGAIIEYGTYKRMATFRNFKFLTERNDELFKVDGQNWEDHTSALTAEDLSNSILVSRYNQVHASVDKGSLAELDIWNLKTSEVRRIPASAMTCPWGTFQRDRSKIIALGISLEMGGMCVREVDLQNGSNRFLGDFSRGSMVFSPVVSHDGKTLALVQMLQGPLLMDTQAILIDIKSNVATKLGEPQGLFGLSWLPDDKGLIVGRRITRGKTEPSIETLCKMDLDGKLTEIRDGKNPLVLSDGNSILFEDKSRAWHICDMDGKILKDITSGKLHYEFQSLNPKGDKVLGVRRGKSDELSEPVQLDPKTGAIQPLTPLPAGLITRVIGQ